MCPEVEGRQAGIPGLDRTQFIWDLLAEVCSCIATKLSGSLQLRSPAPKYLLPRSILGGMYLVGLELYRVRPVLVLGSGVQPHIPFWWLHLLRVGGETMQENLSRNVLGWSCGRSPSDVKLRPSLPNTHPPPHTHFKTCAFNGLVTFSTPQHKNLHPSSVLSFPPQIIHLWRMSACFYLSAYYYLLIVIFRLESFFFFW